MPYKLFGNPIGTASHQIELASLDEKAYLILYSYYLFKKW